MCRIITVANQKGGVSKTTICQHLSFVLAEQGRRVLCVDFDPQTNLSASLLPGGQVPALDISSIMTCLLEDQDLPAPGSYIQRCGKVDLIPGSKNLSRLETSLLTEMGTERFLQEILSPLRARYDYIIIDTNRAGTPLMTNALTAADRGDGKRPGRCGRAALDAAHRGHCPGGEKGGQHRGPHGAEPRHHRGRPWPGSARHGGLRRGQERGLHRGENRGPLGREQDRFGAKALQRAKPRRAYRAAALSASHAAVRRQFGHVRSHWIWQEGLGHSYWRRQELRGCGNCYVPDQFGLRTAECQ